ncbi:YdcF family protein [Psychrobacter sp. T6-6]|uniref:YdcF family protein n=1 Tax=Psychrobacter sp. T6-6 TaxID=3457452 RepID=UPI003FD4A182
MFGLLRIVLIALGLILIIDCIALIAIDKVNFGTVLPFLIGVVFLGHGLGAPMIARVLVKHPVLRRIWYGLWLIFGLWLMSFLVFVYSLQQQIARGKQTLPPVAAIIVLGSGTVAGKPSATLASRLDTAATLIEQQPQALIITSGGIGLGQPRSEANIMATYLQDTHDISLDRIYQEGKSTSTEENLAYSQDILAQHSINKNMPIAIVTSDFHTIRAVAIAKHQDYQQPMALASPTPLSIRYNAWFREYFAFGSGWLLKEY